MEVLGEQSGGWLTSRGVEEGCRGIMFAVQAHEWVELAGQRRKFLEKDLKCVQTARGRRVVS